MNKFELPETYRWYRESVQWILTLALGGLAGLLGLAGFSEKITGAGIWAKLFFILTGIVVLAVIIAGVGFNLFIADWGNALENKNELEEKRKAKSGLTAEEEKEAGDAEEKRKRSAESCKFCFDWLLRSFGLSLFLYALTGLWFLLTPSEKAQSLKYDLAVVRRISPGKKGADSYLLNKETGELYRLAGTSNVWIRIGGTNRIEATPADFSEIEDRQTNDLNAQLNGIRQEIERLNATLSAQFSAGPAVLETNMAALTGELGRIEAAITTLTKAIPIVSSTPPIDFGPLTNELAKIQKGIEELSTKMPLQASTTNAPQLYLRKTGLFIDIGRSELKSK